MLLRLNNLLIDFTTSPYDPKTSHKAVQLGRDPIPQSLDNQLETGNFETLIAFEDSLQRWERDLPEQLQIASDMRPKPDDHVMPTSPHTYRQAIVIRSRYVDTLRVQAWP